MGRLAKSRSVLQRLGPGVLFGAMVSHFATRLPGARHAKSPKPLKVRGLSTPVHVRPGSSDLLVVCQVFGYGDYERLAPLRCTGLVLDLGANIGCASLAFLKMFPGIRIVAVEPDTANAALCRRNLQPFPNAEVIQAAVWNEQTTLAFDPESQGAGHEWGRRVVAQAPQSGLEGVPTVTIEEILARHPGFDIELMKIDIEGAEMELFTEGCHAWLPRVRNILIELHGEAAHARFDQAMSRYTHEREMLGEYVFCRNLRPAHTTATPPAREPQPSLA